MSRRKDEENKAAGAEAFRGAIVGAAKWGLIAGGLGAVGYFLSPIYRGLTLQFKVYVLQASPGLTPYQSAFQHKYIQLSGMTLGGWIEADRRLRAYEFRARREKKRQNDEAVWKHWESMIEQQERREQEQKQEQDKG